MKYLYELIDNLTNTVVDSIEMKPKDVIKLKEIKSIKPHKQDKQELLSLDGLYRYLLKPGEEHDDTRKRATYSNWSKKMFMIDRVVDEE